jgi:hypothetical protein
MSRRHRKLALILSIPGIAACLLAITAFFLDFLHNRIPWLPGVDHREQYMAIGQAFGRGFFAGFFLCFFLMLAALSVGSRLNPRLARQKTSRIPE